METAALVAPVTALEFLRDAFLLTGEGPVLTVYSLKPRPKASASLSVLQHYRIHGIRPRNPAAVPAQSSATGDYEENKDGLSSTSEPNFYDLAVFGGKAVRLVRLHTDLKNGQHLCWEILGPLMELQDWALDVRWLSGVRQSLLCVAVAHNSALLLDVITGNALVQRSCLEGCLLYSALLLVHESWTDTVLVGGTVFNQLVLWKPGGGGDKSSDSEQKAPVERRLLGHSGVIFSISYLQEKGLLASASDDRSIRVWGVGALGGPGGKCGDLNPACLMVLYGHQARVFSVRLSSGKAFSAGEDGCCLVWDWAGGGKVVRTLKGHRAGGVRALAVSEGTGDEERWVATGGADGGLRLWMLEGNEERKERIEEAVTEKLTDLKFPGQGLPKEVCIAGEGDGSWSQSKFMVCTDQGIVYQYSNGQWEMVWQGSPEFHSYCVMETITVNVKDSTVKVHLCAVGNLTGSIQVFPISHPQCGILLTGGLGKIHSLIWQEVKESLYLLASGTDGLVHRWCIDVKLDENCSLALIVNPRPPFLLPPCAKRWLTAAVCLHSASWELLWVCGDRRGSLLLFQEAGKQEQKILDGIRMDEGLLTGRKQGVEAEENGSRKKVGDPTLHALSCLFGVHGKQGVTSVCEYQGLLYSSGRDGCVRVFRVCPTPLEKLEEKSNGKSVENKGGLQLEVLRVQRACKGMEWLERVLILEHEIPVEEEEEAEFGQECENHFRTKKLNLAEKMEAAEEEKEEGSLRREEKKMENEGREARFVILGFHAVHFVVWDPVKQERLLAVPCGGGHRSWSLWPSNKGAWPGYGALVFIKQGAVLASQPPREDPSWVGKAGRSGGWGLREGIHGRGISCVYRLGRIRGIMNDIQIKSTGNETEIKGRDGFNDEAREVDRDEGHWEIVVTGGEDTSLSILAVHPNSGSIRVLSVITDHISSVRTVTAVTGPEGGSENQTQSLSALLVSAGGRAQMQCYRLLIGWDWRRLAPSCQVIQVASHRLDAQWERRRNRHKTVKMDPETRYMSAVMVDERTDFSLLALACSDGALRMFSVSEVKREINLLWETFYHQRCVLSVAACSLEDGKGNRYNLMFSAATDGKIAVWDLTEASSLSSGTSSSAPTPPTPCLDIPAHQSGVNALAVKAEKLGQQEGGCLVTIASGGDDGQLTVSKIRVQYPEDGNTGGSRGLSQISEPLTSLQTQFQLPNQLHVHLHSQSHIPLAHAAPLTALKLLSPDLVVSTSSDQRVSLWRVGTAGISHIGALCSHVADAAGLAVWEGRPIEEGEDKKRKTRFESEQETAIWRGKGNQRGLQMTCETAEGETGGRFNKDKETADGTEGREPVEALSETGGPVCKISDGKGGETAGERGNQTDTDSEGKTESEGNMETGFKASCDSTKKREKTGWVLVCGQGIQLLRVRNAELWTTRGERDKEKVNHRVTLQEKSTEVE